MAGGRGAAHPPRGPPTIAADRFTTIGEPSNIIEQGFTTTVKPSNIVGDGFTTIVKPSNIVGHGFTTTVKPSNVVEHGFTTTVNRLAGVINGSDLGGGGDPCIGGRHGGTDAHKLAITAKAIRAMKPIARPPTTASRITRTWVRAPGGASASQQTSG